MNNDDLPDQSRRELEAAAIRAVVGAGGFRDVLSSFPGIRTDMIENALGVSAGANVVYERLRELGMFDQVESRIVRMTGLSESFAANIAQDSLGRIAAAQGWGALAGQVLSRRTDYSDRVAEPSAYSEEMTGPADYFEAHEQVIDSFDDLHSEVKTLTNLAGDLPLVWRGAVDANWGLHSNLFRRLMVLNGVAHPSDGAKGAQPFPDEDQMVRAEARMIHEARSRWRLDGTPALELLAKLQHFGAPTRLLDVTRNPYIAAWFAVEGNPKADDQDARLFAVATAPVGSSEEDRRFSEVVMDKAGSAYVPFWHLLRSPQERREVDWGTGARRRIWFPPPYDQRIVAQNAGFILDGVPITASKVASRFPKAKGSKAYWKRSDLLASASIYAKTADPHRPLRSNSANLAPVFTFRITRDAKREIRRHLEKYFDYTAATIYPDIAKLSQHLDQNFDSLLRE